MTHQLSTKTVYQNKWMTVREDEVRFASGQKGMYSVVEKPDFALIIPFDGVHFFLINQFRYPIQKNSWEFPQGSYEKEDADHLAAAQRELKEETGLTAEKIQEIGFFYEADGYCNQGFHIFLATDLQRGQQELETSETGMEVGKFTVQEFEEMVRTGKLRDAPTISAYALFRLMRDPDSMVR